MTMLSLLSKGLLSYYVAIAFIIVGILLIPMISDKSNSYSVVDSFISPLYHPHHYHHPYWSSSSTLTTISNLHLQNHQQNHQYRTTSRAFRLLNDDGNALAFNSINLNCLIIISFFHIIIKHRSFFQEHFGWKGSFLKDDE